MAAGKSRTPGYSVIRPLIVNHTEMPLLQISAGNGLMSFVRVPTKVASLYFFYLTSTDSILPFACNEI